jgi:EAL domain-containing protein (putative c-di-GMP-specific phosphodiesterase class I)
VTTAALATPVGVAGLAGTGVLLVVAFWLLALLLLTRRRLRRALKPGAANVAVHEAARQRVQNVVQRRAVEIALQPVIDLTTGRLAGTEALARFPDGRAPDIWLAEAADTGQGLAMDRLVFTSAVRQLKRLPAHCYLSVNATPELIMHGRLVESLSEAHVPLERLVIEVTEHVKIASYGELHMCLAPLRERGVRLAIDDTGAGYASFNHVLQLRPDIIKIDRSLIANVTEDAARRSLVTALVLLALDLDATVVAEGVETFSELTTLGALGIDCAQGYLLARPSTDHSRWRRWCDAGRVWDTGQQRSDSGRLVTIPDRPLVEDVAGRAGA